MMITDADVKLARTIMFDFANLQANGKPQIAEQLLARTFASLRGSSSESAKSTVRVLWCVVHQLPDQQFEVDLSQFNPSGTLKVTPSPEKGAHIQLLEALDHAVKEAKQ
jgi:hypothetical protein